MMTTSRGLASEMYLASLRHHWIIHVNDWKAFVSRMLYITIKRRNDVGAAHNNVVQLEI